MIVSACPSTFDDQFDRFRRAVHALFPILGYGKEATETFIGNNSELYADSVFIVETGGGQAAFGRKCNEAETGDGWHLVYLIPSDWSERYTILRRALEEIKSWYVDSRADSPLVHRIEEQAPSHNAYYAGMLAGMGFILEPRMRMTAGLEVVREAGEAELPTGVREAAFARERAPALIDQFLRAYSFHQERWSAARAEWFRNSMANRLAEAYENEDWMESWVGVECDGEVIGQCFGSEFRDQLFIEELAILPEYYGKGIGRYLLNRCMRTLNDRHGAPGRRFVLDTWRTHGRAFELYRRTGFAPSRWYSDASYRASD